ncbi:hypothetical protein PIB30_115138, partial [Stylosanthes scabra]|nr:hypothetical protein [Stylosanthes scabra]
NREEERTPPLPHGAAPAPIPVSTRWSSTNFGFGTIAVAGGRLRRRNRESLRDRKGSCRCLDGGSLIVLLIVFDHQGSRKLRRRQSVHPHIKAGSARRSRSSITDPLQLFRSSCKATV